MSATTYSPQIQSLLSRRASVLSQTPHTAPPTVADFAAGLKADPNRPLTMIVSCADPRVIPEAMFGLGGGEAVVIRNAGGDVQKALPDILAIDSLLKFSDVMVVRHTDCGTTHFHDEDVRAQVKARDGVTSDMKGQLDNMRFGAAENGVRAAMKQDVEFLRQTPLMRAELRKGISGFVYDLETGELKAE